MEAIMPQHHRNSTYGALLNPSFRFARKEMGASVTACGREITTHMMQKIHELLDGSPARMIKSTEVDKDGKLQHIYDIDSNTIIYGDTDSVAGDSVVETSHGSMTVEKLFASMDVKWKVGHNELASSGQKVLTSCYDRGRIAQKPIAAVYRHKVKKARYRITLENGASVIVTGDHSIMVLRDGTLVSVCAADINSDTDTCITIGTSP